MSVTSTSTQSLRGDDSEERDVKDFIMVQRKAAKAEIREYARNHGISYTHARRILAKGEEAMTSLTFKLDFLMDSTEDLVSDMGAEAYERGFVDADPSATDHWHMTERGVEFGVEHFLTREFDSARVSSVNVIELVGPSGHPYVELAIDGPDNDAIVRELNDAYNGGDPSMISELRDNAGLD